jgi:tRNA-specific 2-thiouridylase
MLTRSTDKQKVVLGFSGGVDSTAAALLLIDKGWEVTGVYLDVLGNNPKGENDAREIADDLGIDMVSIDVSKEFSEVVISNFCSEYMKGRTPNPCIICNPEIKFKYLLKAADECGAYFIATGHYANIFYSKDEDCCFISKAKSAKKDQSYMLYRLNGSVLSRLMFPLGDFGTKEEVRNFVDSKGIKNAEKKDSQEICFIPEGIHYVSYLTSRGWPIEKGQFVNSAGETMGTHQGIPNYTIGQRKHLGMTFGKPVFVVKLDDENNKVVLGTQEELFSNKVVSKHNWFHINDGNIMPSMYEGMKVEAKVRYAAPPSEAIINKMDEDTVCAVFTEAQRAITPGQSIVFYDGDKVIGGGIIDG